MKKGFVLMETIIVVSVLCIAMVLLYGAYSNIKSITMARSLYDNTEYIYKTAVVRDYLKEGDLSLDDYDRLCQDGINGNGCSSDEVLEFLRVKAIYIMDWNFDNSLYKNVESEYNATTIKYLDHIDADSHPNWKRIVVMYYDVRDDTNLEKYQYASLRYFE